MSYTKTTWSDGDIITANKMNNIETGVESLNTDVGQLQTDLDSLTGTVENLPTGGDYQELVDDVADIKADLTQQSLIPYKNYITLKLLLPALNGTPGLIPYKNYITLKQWRWLIRRMAA